MMENVFLRNQRHSKFSWESLSQPRIQEGRGDLGEDMPVMVHRMAQSALLDVLSEIHGEKQANEYFRKAGYLAGSEFARNVLDLNVDFNTFLANLQQQYLILKVGVLRVESCDLATGNFVLTVGEDLACSGLPVTNETVCHFDVGFFSGIFEIYTGKKYDLQEIDCWATGARVCRFQGISLK